MSLRQEVAREIDQAREAAGVSRVELARRLGASPSRVTLILSGRANLTLETLVQIATALGFRWECRARPDERPS